MEKPDQDGSGGDEGGEGGAEAAGREGIAGQTGQYRTGSAKPRQDVGEAEHGEPPQGVLVS